MKQIKVLVTGDRDLADKDLICEAFNDLEEQGLNIYCVVHGDARGIDKTADQVAKEMGIETDPNPAQWGRYKRAAGPIRNQAMLDKHPDIDIVLAFHNNLDRSKGTKDMVNRSLKKKLRVLRYFRRAPFAPIQKVDLTLKYKV